MSTYRVIVRGLYCDAPDCPELIEDGGSAYGYDELRRTAHTAGWRRVVSSDYCPKHAP
jgi:hypothetical protein